MSKVRFTGCGKRCRNTRRREAMAPRMAPDAAELARMGEARHDEAWQGRQG